jgi:hypothetical protein
MKNKKLLAVAIAATLSAGAAQAGTLAVNNIAGKSSQFATHIFGEGSEAQAVYLPDLVYKAAAAIPAGTEIRFNLLDNAVFNDAITIEHFAVNQGGAIGVGSHASAGVQIVSGGVNGAFHVTVKLGVALAAGDTLSLLARGQVPSGTYANEAAVTAVVATNTNIEVRNVKPLGVAGTTIKASVSIQGGIDLTPSTVIAVSADPLKLTALGTLGGQNPNTINMSNSDLKFSAGAYSNAGLNAGQVFNHAGTLQFVVTTNTDSKFQSYNGLDVTLPAVTAAANVAAGQISDPAGNQYAPDGADTVNLTITSSSETGLNSLKEVDFVSGGTCSSATLSNNKFTLGAQTATINWTANDYLSAYSVCAVAKGDAAIEPQSFSAVATYNNAEPTYQDPAYKADNYGSWVRNGCSAAFFNVTAANGTSADETFLRLTNTTGSAGPVRVRAWAQDGTRLGADGALLSESLAGHATAVFTPEQVQEALGVEAWAGRARVVLFGGFQNCVGQNMTRAGSVLINSTATTDGNNDGQGSSTNSGN